MECRVSSSGCRSVEPIVDRVQTLVLSLAGMVGYTAIAVIFLVCRNHMDEQVEHGGFDGVKEK